MATGLIARMWNLIHKKMEKPFRKAHEERVLEIGSGNGEHLKAVSHDIESYYATDIRVDLLSSALQGREKVIVEMQDVTDLSYEDGFFDRVIITCVLVHLDNPILALNEISRVIKPGGYVSIYLPCEPGIFLRAVRRFSTHAKAKRIGVDDISYLHFLEHKNYFIAVDFFIRRTFKESKVQSRYYPFPFLTWNFNLFKLYTIRKPS
jgi:ubiquinone/menaquinone biosynthesis C-methylase UbiE